MKNESATSIMVKAKLSDYKIEQENFVVYTFNPNTEYFRKEIILEHAEEDNYVLITGDNSYIILAKLPHQFIDVDIKDIVQQLWPDVSNPVLLNEICHGTKSESRKNLNI